MNPSIDFYAGSRRAFLRTLALGAVAGGPLLAGLKGAVKDSPTPGPQVKNPERQPSGDLGNGFYRNPVIMAGDIADLTVIRIDRDYYLMHGYNCAPGFPIWHSRDLVNWQPVKKLRPEQGPGGPDLDRFGPGYRLYSGGSHGIAMRSAPAILGPWSDPVALGGNAFDVAHLDTSDGKHYLIGGGALGAGVLQELSPDGRSLVASPPLGYAGWPIPENWDVEGLFLEGWNTTCRDGYYYILAAQGGTSGPPTSHMCVAARSRSVHGPWENSPYNPIIHTYSKDEPFWSKGQGVLIDTPEGDWYILYHGYLHGARNLGRQVFLEPIEWTPDGWFRVPEGIRSDQPIRKPKGDAVPHGFVLSDDFGGPELDVKWGFRAASAEGRYRFVGDGLALCAEGQGIADAVPMVMPVLARAYEFTAEMTVPAGVEGGVTVYANARAHVSMSLKAGGVSGRSVISSTQRALPYADTRIFFRLIFQDDLVRLYFGPDGRTWTKLALTAEVSSFNRNALGGIESVQPGCYACGSGEAIIHHTRFRPLL